MTINYEFNAFMNRIREGLPEHLLEGHPDFVRRREAFNLRTSVDEVQRVRNAGRLRVWR